LWKKFVVYVRQEKKMNETPIAKIVVTKESLFKVEDEDDGGFTSIVNSETQKFDQKLNAVLAADRPTTEDQLAEMEKEIEDTEKKEMSKIKFVWKFQKYLIITVLIIGGGLFFVFFIVFLLLSIFWMKLDAYHFLAVLGLVIVYLLIQRIFDVISWYAIKCTMFRSLKKKRGFSELI
jgi:hypothetical protein